MARIRRLLKQVRTVLVSWKRVSVLFWSFSPGLVTTLVLLTIVGGILPSLQIQLTGSIVQSVADAIRGGKTAPLISRAVYFGLLQGALVFFSLLLGTVQQYLTKRFQLLLSNKTSLLVMEKALKLDLQHYEDDEIYDSLQRANNESRYRSYQIFSQMTSLASQAVTLVSVTLSLVATSPLIALLLLVSPLPALISQTFYSQKMYKVQYERAQERRKQTYLQQLVTNARSFKEIRLFRLGDLFLERYQEFMELFFKVDDKLNRQYSLASVALGTITVIASVGAQIYTIFFAITSGSIGLLAAYVQAIGVVQRSVQGLLTGFGQLYQNNLFIHNLFDFIDIAPSQIRSGKQRFPRPLRKGIEFRHVSFRYPGTSRIVLNDLNLILRAGECVALVGQNGSGKTTIVKLLSRLYEPTSGYILIDDMPIECFDLEDLRRNVGVIFQDFVQYEMSVRENIGFGDVDAFYDIGRIQTAAEESGADSIVEKLPEFYDTTLGRMFEKGHELSGGQWQKVALARAFMSKAPVMILDEPTAAIDAKAEAEMFGRLRQIAKGATTLLIAHRFSTVRMADRIVVLERGRVIEEGNHETLMRLGGTYAYLFNLQASGYRDTVLPSQMSRQATTRQSIIRPPFKLPTVDYGHTSPSQPPAPAVGDADALLLSLQQVAPAADYLNNTLHTPPPAGRPDTTPPPLKNSRPEQYAADSRPLSQEQEQKAERSSLKKNKTFLSRF
jgi:ATP-binding cassette, subfamily B, bacterial